MEILKTSKYFKSLKNIPTKAQDAIEAAVDRLESDLTGVVRIEGTLHQARLDVGEYRIFLTRQKDRAVALIVREAVRRTSTTYRKRK